MTMSYQEFLALSTEKQAQALKELRQEHGVGNLVKMWGISTSRLYKLIHDLDLPVSKRGRKAKSQKKPTVTSPENNADIVAPVNSSLSLANNTSKLTFTLSAEGEGKLLLGRLQPLLMAMSDSDLKYKISIIAEQI